MVKSMISNTNLPLFLWSEVLKTITYILNRVPIKAVFKMPFELWKGYKHSLRHVHVWGCPAEVGFVIHKRRSKTQEQSVDILLAIQKSLRDTDFIVLLVQ